jgi:hypothetical protein
VLPKKLLLACGNKYKLSGRYGVEGQHSSHEIFLEHLLCRNQ